MGAFNEWVKGTPLEQPEHRQVVNVALNLMYGAAVSARVSQLRQSGVSLPASRELTAAVPSSEIEEYLA
jgi:hypothetical protein